MNTKAASAKLRVLFAFLVTLFAAVPAWPQSDQPFSINNSPLPAPTGFVNDFAGVIDPATKQQIEQKILAFRERTNPPVELAVAVVRTTGDRDIFDYSLAVARGWKIGSKEDDNPSALLFVAIDDRKYFTQVSKDLEDELPDGVVGSLQRQYLVPEFKKGNYGKGISDTIAAYTATIEAKQSGNPTPTPNGAGGPTVGSYGGSLFSTICCLIVIVVILLLIFIPRRRGPNRNDRDRWGGGGGGGFGQVAASALPWVVGSILSSGSGSSSSDWGGSSGGGGSDWGGFGGGGDFGGGGAGGSW